MIKKYVISACAFSTAALATAATVVPLVVLKENKENKKLGVNIFNRTFDSREDLIEYALKNAKKIKTKDGKVYWTLKDNSERTFNTNLELREYVSKNIEAIKVKNYSEDILNGTNNSLSKNSINQILTSTSSSAKRYYRGVHDTIFQDRLNAILSYFQYHKVFKYNGITFRDKTELKLYLYKNYGKLPDFKINNQKHDIESPDGLRSNFFDLQNKDDRNMARDFISNMATNLIGIKNQKGEYDYVSSKDIIKQDITNNIWANFNINQINAVHIKANNGKVLWITDSSREDKNNFYGDYFTKSKTNEISGINNSQNWDSTNDAPDASSLAKTKNIDKVGKFFAILNKLSTYANLDFNDKEAVKNAISNKSDNIFDVPKYKKIIDDEIKNNPNVLKIIEKLKETSNSLSNGKRYNPLYEVPLLYTQTLWNISRWGIKNEELNFMRQFFKTIMDDYQNSLNALLPKNALIDRGGKKLDLASLFGINDSSYDLNSTPESQMFKLTESPKFIEAISFYMDLITNKISNGGGKPFYMVDIDENKNSKSEFEKIWNLLSGKVSAINGGKKSSDEELKKSIQKILGKKVWNDQTPIEEKEAAKKQSSLILNLMKVNDELEKSNNNILAKSNLAIFDDAIKNPSFINGKEINWDSISQNSFQQNEETISKAKKLLELKNKVMLKETDKNQINNIKAFRDMVSKINIKDNYLEKLSKSISESEIEEGLKQDILESLRFKHSPLSYIVKSNISSSNDKGLTKEQDSRSKKNDDKSNKIAKKIMKAPKIKNIISDVVGLVQNIQNEEAFDILKSVSRLAGSIGSLTAALPFVGVAFQVLSFATDFAGEIMGKNVEEIYKFRTTEQGAKNFYWDGGRSTVRFWGLFKSTTTGKNDMKISAPLKITRDSQKDYWYYNGKTYKDENEMRKQALLDFANGDDNAVMLGAQNKTLIRRFTFEKMPKNKSLAKGALVSKSRQELANLLIKEPKGKEKFDEVNSKINKHIKSSRFSIIGGKVAQMKHGTPANNIDVKKENINGLIDQIRPTIVAQLPENINAVPLDQLGKKYDDRYVLPGEKFYVDGNIVNRKKDNNQHYLQINLNQLDANAGSKENVYRYNSIENAIDVMKESFLNTISVKSMYSLKNQYLSVNKFSSLKTYKEYQIFKAKGIGGEIKYFNNYTDAYTWLISENEFNLKTMIEKGSNEKIFFDNKMFNNTFEFIKYLDSLLFEGKAKNAK